MVKRINYPVATPKDKSALEQQIEDHVLLSAFRDLTISAEGYTQYTNDYGFVEDWRDTEDNYKTPAEIEFSKLARAGVRSMKHAYSPSPLDMLSHPPVPNALMKVYYHMGYTPIEDAIFFGMVAAFEAAQFWQPWGSLENNCVDNTAYIHGIGWWRTFPTAITYMDKFEDVFEDILDFIFYDLRMACGSYLDYTNDFDDWNDPKIAAFREFSEVAEYVTYVCPDWFQKFLDLPGELRESIMHDYALMERDAGRLSKHQHFDEFNNPCCKWEYPKVLIACDNQNTKVFPDASTGRCPKGWLPNLAFVSHRMHEETLVLMLQRTARFDLKYIFRNTNFKIATWFTKFLKTIPGGDGEIAVKHLNFPHMHWFNHQRISPALTNRSFELAVACKNLRKLDMTFHVDKVTISNAHTDWERKALPLATIIDRFKLETIFGCTRLEEVYIDGIYMRPSRGGKEADLDVLEDASKWMMKSFLVRRNPERGIQVELVRRWGCWRGRVRGTLLELDDVDLAEVKTRIEMKSAYTKALALAGPATTV
ncbi:hypothetical protein BKA58DRAFT_431451 [Alternaria rosae]|uniref:uncharacterized protein n=1 Tax=Alternaria rosae TaxID=1187941 RepID=UPI001E8CB89C|nr:uncharacterized protein BKA58DRAFT_431451 [Alternaria rosae]KAH6864841.1 hypothetical protein BKA58DRAFT_431451 [Alternaria rosae]